MISNIYSIPLYCLLGIPVNRISEARTVEVLWHAVRNRQKMVLTTPNLNFVMNCRKNAVFLNSVLQSDLNVADGMPLVWIARLLGISIKDRVAGSSIFEHIKNNFPPDHGPPMRIFFFGGAPGVARQAHENINSNSHGMLSVGFIDPGFVSVDEMSSQQFIDQINASQADFIVVALGAEKGQAWIQKNRGRLSASVLSHLGAVINFSAGSVKRAPLWMQKSGMEWLWRIKEEPKLWRRYAADGLSLCKILFCEVFPLLLHQKFHLLCGTRLSYGLVEAAVKFEGAQAIVWPAAQMLEEIINSLDDFVGEVYIDWSHTLLADSATLGLLLTFIGRRSSQGRKTVSINVSQSLRRQLNWYGLSYL